MRNKTSQPGFTLIELIAVMVILGILAAVIIPRISTLTQGAFESNVRSMFGVIKNEVSAQALKAAMRGGSGGHREKFPNITDGQALNYYLDRWVDEYDDALWVEQGVAAGLNTSWANTNKFASGANPDVLIFGYFPHGIHSTVYDDGWGGTSTDKEDIYFIYYMPITTLRGKAGGYDYDGFVMVAAQDADLDQTPDVKILIDGSAGTVAVDANGDDVITDITYISSADPDS